MCSISLPFCWHIVLGEFIYQNYWQALEKIQYDAELGTTPSGYDGYLKSECDYLKSLKMEPIEVTSKVNYMELLVKLHHLQYVSFFE